MPANLTFRYHQAEAAYREASTPLEEFDCLQAMLRELPKHKGTDKLHADLKQKISKLKLELEKARTTGRRQGFRLPQQGAGRAVIIGGPNSGKSQLLKSLTRAQPDVAAYPFTTRQPLPGMMPWEDVYVQLVDTAPVTADLLAAETQSLIRSADLVLLLLDLGSDEGGEQCNEVLQKLAQSKTRLANETFLDRHDIGVSYTQTFFIPNKIELADAVDRREFFREIVDHNFQEFPVSAERGHGLGELRDAIYKSLDVVRIYTKLPTSKEPDFQKPFTLRRGATLLDVAKLVHDNVAANLKRARVWGKTVHDATIVNADFVLSDQDIVELHI